MIKVEKLNDIHSLRVVYNQTDKWEQWVLLMSDVHFDSPKCDRKLLKKHLDEAKEKNGVVMIFGDWYDAMGGRFDPRSNKGDVRPEYNVKGYFDAIVKDSYNFLEPYKDNVRFMSYGNHEISVLNRQEVDLMKNLTEKLECETGDYQGFIKFMFNKKNKNSESSRSSKLLYYTHGSGGNSPVTRGVIKTNRRNATIQSDIFVSGHIHNEWVVNLPMVRVSDMGKIKKTDQTHISLGCYKDDSFAPNGGGWADMKEFPPPSMGGCWIRFYYDKTKGEVTYQTIRAI